MKIHMKSQLVAAAVLMDLLATSLLGGITAAAQPAEQGDLLSVIQQFISAWNAGDTATLGNILDQSYQAAITNMPLNAPPQASQPTSRDAELQNAGQRLVHVTASNCAQTSATTVRCDVGLSGGPTANLPHPYTETALFTFSNGKIVRNDETLSDATRNDFAQLFASLPQQQPGMPTTGQPNGVTTSGLLFFLLACGGVLFAAGGALLRRGASRSA